MKKLLSLLLVVGLLSFMGCTTEKQLKEQMKKVLAEDPGIVISVIKAKPLEFIEALQEAARSAQMEMAKKQEDDRKKEFEDSFNKPLEPKIYADASFRGNKSAVLTLVEYSDFECPYCSRGAKTVEEVMKKYEGKIRFTFKHLPLDFHQNAMISAQYYEAIRLQDQEKAWKFHDSLFENQKELSKGEAFLKELAKKVGADMTKLAKDITSDAVKNRIAEDQKEAQEFGFQGTPGYVINGIPVRGAYPASHFDTIVEELKKRGKVTL
ncbi:MAG: thioredoxin domain-containing protein [Oligoflexia bacterium]|nr:thioredoxin domain-containing protein [Oligoflexia bacterium]MBF0364183.1 thioredoxin domain-containing protein [Oligoflexia bacterium]